MFYPSSILLWCSYVYAAYHFTSIQSFALLKDFFQSVHQKSKTCMLVHVRCSMAEFKNHFQGLHVQQRLFFNIVHKMKQRLWLQSWKLESWHRPEFRMKRRITLFSFSVWTLRRINVVSFCGLVGKTNIEYVIIVSFIKGQLQGASYIGFDPCSSSF